MNNNEQSGSASTVLQNPNIQVALKFLRDNGTLVALVILALFFTFIRRFCVLFFQSCLLSKIQCISMDRQTLMKVWISICRHGIAFL